MHTAHSGTSSKADGPLSWHRCTWMDRLVPVLLNADQGCSQYRSEHRELCEQPAIGLWPSTRGWERTCSVPRYLTGVGQGAEVADEEAGGAVECGVRLVETPVLRLVDVREARPDLQRSARPTSSPPGAGRRP